MPQFEVAPTHRFADVPIVRTVDDAGRATCGAEPALRQLQRLVGNQAVAALATTRPKVQRLAVGESGSTGSSGTLDRIEEILGFTWVGPSNEEELESLWSGFGSTFPAQALASWDLWERSIGAGLDVDAVSHVPGLIRTLVADPHARGDRAVSMIQLAGMDQLYEVTELKHEDRIHLIAASEPGRAALRAAQQRFEDNNDFNLAKQIADEFENRDNPAPASAASVSAVALINEALEDESSFKQMLYDDWLRLPVQPFNWSTVEDGGVYYDPRLGTKAALEADRKSAGKTEGIEWHADAGDGVPARLPLIYIRVGPRATADRVAADRALAAATDPDATQAAQTAVDQANAFIRSAVYHEWRHYRDYKYRRDDDSTVEERERAGQTSNAETRAYAAQIFDYATELSTAQIVRLLRTVAESLPISSDAVQRSSVAQIVDGIAPPVGDAAANVERLEDVAAAIAALPEDERTALTPVSTAIDQRIGILSPP